MILFLAPEGPKMSYDNGMLVMEDLNPEQKMTWRMSRGDMVRLALKCLRCAITRGNQGQPPLPREASHD